LVEARRGKEFFGEERLISSVMRHCHSERPVRSIIQEVERHCKNHFTDDITVLSLKVKKLKKERDQLNLRLGRLFHN